MKPGYDPKTLGGALMWLGEECNEVGQAVFKTTRIAFECEEMDPPLSCTVRLLWALEGGNPELPPETRETNREWILRELGDLELAIQNAKRVLAE